MASPSTIRQKFCADLLIICLVVLGMGGWCNSWADDSYDKVLENLRKKTVTSPKDASGNNSEAQPSTTKTKEIVDTSVKKSTEKSSVAPSTKKTSSNKKINLFGTIEFRGNIKKLPKWSKVLSKMENWRGYLEDPKTNGLKSRKSWRALTDKVAASSKMEQVKAVNKYFNKWPYRLDKGNYGTSEYWASPPEFLRNSGDCEDYAIAKFYGLKEFGFTGDDMRVVALKDTIRNIGHAVLVVYIDGGAYVLDNQTNMVRTHERYRHYRPYYSVNERYRWMHVPPMKKK